MWYALVLFIGIGIGYWVAWARAESRLDSFESKIDALRREITGLSEFPDRVDMSNYELTQEDGKWIAKRKRAMEG